MSAPTTACASRCPHHKRGAGEGSIDQRPDGLWRGRVMVGRKLDGKPDVRVVYGKTRGECLMRFRCASGEKGEYRDREDANNGLDVIFHS